MLKRIPLRLKLLLSTGVPVVGALILATWIARDAQHQAESAAALGSIEDLARLSAQMSGLVHALQFERNELSLRMAQKAFTAPDLQRRFASTDAARDQLAQFLSTRQLSSLPPRLARDLNQAQQKLSALQAERTAATSGTQPLDELAAYYDSTNQSLISSTAALAQLTDDGQLLRAISALVTVLQIKERASEEHALLSHVFTLREFPPGAYKELVELATEEVDYVKMLEFNATDSVNKRFAEIHRGPEFTRTAELRKIALETADDNFGVQPLEWSDAQGLKIHGYHTLEIALAEEVKVAALAKLAAVAQSVVLSYGLAAGVIVLSALLAGFIARGISRSVASLSEAAARVLRDQDFGVRALKTTEDEVGALTDAFNEMLAGIQRRDGELREHRENLEQQVEQRTAALSNRNLAMRLVLDNVEQGLATIEIDGKLASERSRVFDDWFGRGETDDFFAQRLARHNETMRASLELGWQQVVDGFFPVETAIDQLPRHLQLEGHHYHLDYKPIVERDALRGALLVVSNVTQEMERARRDAEQREMLGVFERIMRDRSGFGDFFAECDGLVQQVASGKLPDRQLLMRAVHTLKGNCSMFGIGSVAAAAHQFESAIVEARELPGHSAVAALAVSWEAFSKRVLRLFGSEAQPVLEVASDELDALESATAAGAPHARLSELLARLKYERGGVRLLRVGEQAKLLAERLGKGGLEVQVDAGNEVRFQPQHWAPFWSAFVHVLRNAVDHGIEMPDARSLAGKPRQGLLRLSAQTEGERLTIEVSDDGRGIDWERVRDKAKQRGLAYATDQDLTLALFSDGLSTADSVGDISGRGVGLSAVRDAVNALGGAVSVISTRGMGSTFRFSFPSTVLAQAPTNPRHCAVRSAPSGTDSPGAAASIRGGAA